MVGATSSVGMTCSAITSSPGLDDQAAVERRYRRRSASGSTSIDMPRGGRPLVTAKWIPASCSSCTAAIERSVSTFSL